MSTRSLRGILQRARRRSLGFRVCIARDIRGPGGGVIIPAQSELTERHLSWLEQRNPAHGHAATYLDVVFVSRSGTDLAWEPPVADAVAPDGGLHDADQERRARARAAEVGSHACEVFRLVDQAAFPPAMLRNPRVQSNLHELDSRMRSFHAAARGALDEYLAGNTLIMDLIAAFGAGPHDIQHGLNVAVLATEVATQVRLADAAAGGLQVDPDLSRELAQVFVGGFLHDCGLWQQGGEAVDGHESAGARLAQALPVASALIPGLVAIILCHSDIGRLARYSHVVQIETLDAAGNLQAVQREFHSSEAAVRTALRAAPDRAVRPLDPGVVRQILPVALAECYLTRTDGFHAESASAVVTRLAAQASGGWYERFLAGLCNVRGLAPRRAHVTLWPPAAGVMVPGGRGSMLPGHAAAFEACSLGHGEDRYSPHLVVLFALGHDGVRRKLAYVDPREGAFWGRNAPAGQRFYVALGRHHPAQGREVTGFMRAEMFDRVLGEYETELQRQMPV